MITSFFESFMSKIYIPSISVIDIIEIAIISFLTFRIILWLRSTKAWSMLKGVAVIIIFIFIAYILNMRTILWIVKRLVDVGLIAFVILLQPEIRRALEKLGVRFFKTGGLFKNNDSYQRFSQQSIFEIVNANHYNMDLGLKEKEKFDLKLDMNVSKVTITNPKLDTQTKEYNSNYVMVSLLNTYVEYSTVLVEYTLSVTNQGKVAGYAKELIDYLPAGMAFSSDLNNNWYLGTDGNLYTTSLANTLINPGETKNVKLVLSKKMTGENVGLVHNVAEISKDYNEYGLRDGNSTPGNKQDGENDMTAADVLLSMSTGREIASFMGITIGIIAVVAVVAFLIRKYIIRRI